MYDDKEQVPLLVLTGPRYIGGGAVTVFLADGAFTRRCLNGCQHGFCCGTTLGAHRTVCVDTLLVCLGETFYPFWTIDGVLAKLFDVCGLKGFHTCEMSAFTFVAARRVDLETMIDPFPVKSGHRMSTKFSLWVSGKDIQLGAVSNLGKLSVGGNSGGVCRIIIVVHKKAAFEDITIIGWIDGKERAVYTWLLGYAILLEFFKRASCTCSFALRQCFGVILFAIKPRASLR